MPTMIMGFKENLTDRCRLYSITNSIRPQHLPLPSCRTSALSAEARQKPLPLKHHFIARSSTLMPTNKGFFSKPLTLDVLEIRESRKTSLAPLHVHDMNVRAHLLILSFLRHGRRLRKALKGRIKGRNCALKKQGEVQ